MTSRQFLDLVGDYHITVNNKKTTVSIDERIIGEEMEHDISKDIIEDILEDTLVELVNDNYDNGIKINGNYYEYDELEDLAQELSQTEWTLELYHPLAS